MNGYYVVWTGDTEDYPTKKDALKRARQIYNDGLDNNVFIQRYNDGNDDGYFAGESTLFIKDI